MSAWCDCTKLEEPESYGVHLKPSSLSPTKDKIDLAESQGDFWEGKKICNRKKNWKLIKTVILCCRLLLVQANNFKPGSCSGKYSMSSALATTKGAITQLELPSRAFRTHLTVRSGILKRYLKETFCLSFPFLCSPGASDVTERYKLRNARICEFGVAVRFFPLSSLSPTLL